MRVQINNITKTYITGLALTLTLLATVGCGKSSGSSETPASAAAAITVTQSPTTVTAGGSMVITPAGGTPPYTFMLTSGSTGTLTPTTGTYSVYTSTGGNASVQVTDSVGNTNVFTVSGSTVNNALVINPSYSSVAINGTLTFSVTGGAGSGYIYQVISPVGAGYFNGNVYYAPGIAETVTIQVSDGSGNASQTMIYVGGTTTTTTTTSACQGTFAMNLDGTTAVLTIAAPNSNGSFLGNLQVGTGVAAIQGTCVGGQINFINYYSTSTYVGSYIVNASNSAQIVMTGSFTDSSGYQYPWYAQNY